MWTFIEIVGEGRDPDRGNTAIHSLRGRFNDGSHDLVIETFFYYTPASTYVAPTNPQKAARRDLILNQLNAPSEEYNLFDEYRYELIDYYRRARRAGNTRNNILIAIRNTFLGLIGNG